MNMSFSNLVIDDEVILNNITISHSRERGTLSKLKGGMKQEVISVITTSDVPEYNFDRKLILVSKSTKIGTMLKNLLFTYNIKCDNKLFEIKINIDKPLDENRIFTYTFSHKGKTTKITNIETLVKILGGI